MRRYGREPDYTMGQVILILGIWVFCLIGWVLNVVAIWNTIDNPVTAKFILRVVGIFVAPIGTILGYVS